MSAIKEFFLRNVNNYIPLGRSEGSLERVILPGTDRCVLLNEFRKGSGWANAIFYTPNDPLNRFQVIRCAKKNGQYYFFESNFASDPRLVPIADEISNNPLLKSQLLVFGADISVGEGKSSSPKMNEIVINTLIRVGYGSLIDPYVDCKSLVQAEKQTT